jgi:hypothetical protein
MGWFTRNAGSVAQASRKQGIIAGYYVAKLATHPCLPLAPVDFPSACRLLPEDLVTCPVKRPQLGEGLNRHWTKSLLVHEYMGQHHEPSLTAYMGTCEKRVKPGIWEAAFLVYVEWRILREGTPHKHSNNRCTRGRLCDTKKLCRCKAYSTDLGRNGGRLGMTYGFSH